MPFLFAILRWWHDRRHPPVRSVHDVNPECILPSGWVTSYDVETDLWFAGYEGEDWSIQARKVDELVIEIYRHDTRRRSALFQAYRHGWRRVIQLTAGGGQSDRLDSLLGRIEARHPDWRGVVSAEW